MLLSRVHIATGGPLAGLTLDLDDAAGSPRRLVVVFGGEGVGKTTLLAAVTATRPGHAIAQSTPVRPGAASDEPPYVATDWILGDDDPARPHPLRVVSPNGKVPGERDDAALLRRREQALFDRRAGEGGFALAAFSGARWFSRTASTLTTPMRSVLRYDPRAALAFDDATRADLTREVKQVLSFAAIASALAGASADQARFAVLDGALRGALAILLQNTGASYEGASPETLEPVFTLDGARADFDDLPRSLRHRVAFGVLAVRTLAAAYPDRDPRVAEGVVLLDDLEVQQDARAAAGLPALLHKALPRVQWIVTTAAPQVAAGCDASEVVVLRRLPGADRVSVHQGHEAIVH